MKMTMDDESQTTTENKRHKLIVKVRLSDSGELKSDTLNTFWFHSSEIKKNIGIEGWQLHYFCS